MRPLLRFKRIEQWPRPFTRRRRYSPFKSSLEETFDLLETELERLSVQTAFICAAVRASDILHSGRLRSGARPEHPGILLTFDCIYGSLGIHCDEMREWPDNLRAIALHLHHLRKATMYGVGSYGEAYRGWRLKETVTESDSALHEAAARIAEAGGCDPQRVKEEADVFREAYRRAALRLHPDNPETGDAEGFVALQKAAEALRRHHHLSD